MADQYTPNHWIALDANGDPVAGALAYWYEAGTSTPLTVYTDSALSVAHATPQVADANGVFAQVWVAVGTAGKVDVQDPDTATSLPGYPQDNVGVSAGSGATASTITFAPVTGNTATDVQTAIANNVTSIRAADNEKRIYTTAGSADAYTITTINTATAYATGQTFRLLINRDNTGAVTLNVDGLGAKDVQVYDSAASLAALAAGEWQIGQIIVVTYDGTRFVQQTPLAMTQAEAEAGTADFPRLVTPAVVKAGIRAFTSVLQVGRTQSATRSTTTTAMPFDATIPQITEGKEFMSLAFTPSDASSTLLIEVVAYIGLGGAGSDQFVGALFVDSTANAIASAAGDSHSDGGPFLLHIRYSVAAGSTTERTYRFRAGRNDANTLEFNGQNGAGFLGSTVYSSITITEYL